MGDTGIITGMSFDEYKKAAGLNASSIKRGWTSMFDYNYSLTEEKKTTPAMKLGTALHTLVLEPEKFKESYIVAPKGLDPRTKAYKEWRAEQVDGLEVITETTDITLLWMAENINDHPMAVRILKASGAKEASLFWDEGERRMKGRLDVARQGKHCFLADLKTTAKHDERGFNRAVYDFGYDISAAHYSKGWKSLTDESPRFFLIFVGSTPPHAVTVWELSVDWLRIGLIRRDNILRQVEACEESNEWWSQPPSKDVALLTPPEYIVKEFES